MPDRTRIALDRDLIELRAHQSLVIPTTERPPFERYTVHLMRAWNDSDIDIAVPTAQLISPEGFSLANVTRPLHRERGSNHCEVEVSTAHGRAHYHFVSRHRAPLVALLRRLHALPQRARALRQSRIDVALATMPAPPSMTVHVDPEIRVDLDRLRQRTAPGMIDIVFARPAQPQQIVDMFGPATAWGGAGRPAIAIDIAATRAGHARYLLTWHTGVTTTLVVEIGSRAASNFHQYMLDAAGHHDTAADQVQLPIAACQLSRPELQLAIARLRHHALHAYPPEVAGTITDHAWSHVLERRQVPRSLVYPGPDSAAHEWTRLCGEAIATQRIHQFCNDWFLRHGLPRLALEAFNRIIDNAGQDPAGYLKTVPPLLRQLQVPFSALDHAQVMRACHRLRHAWLMSPSRQLAPAIRRHPVLRCSALRQAMAERGAVIIDWIEPDPDTPAAMPCNELAWSAIVKQAVQSPPSTSADATLYRHFSQRRWQLASRYPDHDQLRREQFKHLLRSAGVQASLHALALVEFEPADQHQAAWPLRLCFLDTLLPHELDGVAPDAGVYQVRTQSEQLAWQAVPLSRPDLTRMLAQADHHATQLHRSALERYWAEHGTTQSGGDGAHALALSAQACLAAHDLCNTGHLSAAGLRLVTAAAGFGMPGLHDIQCHLLDLGGVVSIDLVTIRDGTGTVLLYRPGQWPLWQQYIDMRALRQAMAQDCASAIARRQWASHFDGQTRPDSFKAGVDSLLLRLGQGEAIGQVALADGRVRIVGDIFHRVAQRQQDAAGRSPDTAQAPLESPWNDADRFFDDDLDPPAHPVSGAWPDALVAALRAHGQADQPWHRDSDIVVTPATGLLALPVDVQQHLLGAACRQEQEQGLWHQRAPDIATDGARYMRDFLLETFPDRFAGREPDVDNLVLNEYHPPQSHVAFYMFNDIGLLRRRKASIPLAQLSYRNIDIVNAWHSLVNGGQRYFTVSHGHAVPQYYDEQFDNVVDPQVLVAALIDGTQFDFATHHQRQIALYFAAHGATLARLAREHAQLAAQLMLHEGQLDQRDYRLVMSAFDPAVATDAGVLAYPLRVAGHAARDCLHLRCTSSDRRVLYLAGDELPYRCFDGLAAARKFLLDLGRDGPALDDFAHTHFAREDADERRASGGLRLTLSPGVINILRTIDDAAMLNADPQRARQRPVSRHDAIVRRRSQERLHGLLDQQLQIGGDPFMALVEIARQGAMADAAYFIRSATDRARESWMEYARIVPVDFVEGLAQLALGKTAGELRAARLRLGADLVLTLLPTPIKIRRTANPVIATAGSRSAQALVRSTSRNEPIARMARWFRPAQRINGKIGYPLGPSRPPSWQRTEHKMLSVLLDMRVFNATAYDAQAIAHSAAPPHSPRWYTVATQAVRLDRAATGFFARFVPPPRTYLGALHSVDDVFELAYRRAPETGHGALGRGLVVGENHATTAARRFLDDNLERLAASGVKTLYTEVFKRDADGDLLRMFNRGGDFPGHVLDRLRRLDANATPRTVAEFADGHPSASLLALFDRARRHGIEIRAIDNIPAAAPDYLARKFVSPHPRTSSMNYVAYQIIRHDQAHYRTHPWVAHVGAGHGVRDHGFPGINEITATPSLFVHSTGTPAPLALGDYHLAVDDAGAIPSWQRQD
ncbi:membrane-targeted effector domain-containing toxin [Herbaspirillum sp. YR522]|uniref:membrane-targeted effector domain-containing toxin n=1 Tax=Herbaspirillum sp. YR522 TaxID=1144342 RepID=UPI00026F9169|nr:membrane-targeted effector domain-containing toxin [Herbaspirillum sp. YR522]EJM98216.1 hypothetical protein PMI40_04074 [Herbaspirillum sp. YR522]